MCVYMCMYIYLYLSIYRSIYLSIYLSIYAGSEGRGVPPGGRGTTRRAPNAPPPMMPGATTLAPAE